jgi:very-short-patch-repair endonuclease
MVRHGVLTSVRRGVYAHKEKAAAISNQRIVAVAAVMALMDRCAASHADAAVIHGLDLLARPSGQVISVSRNPQFGPNDRKAGHPRIHVHAVPLPRAHLTMRYRIVVTTVARTVIDVARTRPFRDGVVTADSALRRKKTTKQELRDVAATMARWPGIAKARDVIAFADHRAESPLESISRVAFRDGGLPEPKLQYWIDGGGYLIGRVDFCWPEHMTIAEADGAGKYADPARARQQLQRDTDLRDAGYQVTHFTWQEIDRVPAVVIGRVRASFEHNAAIRAAQGPV